MIQEASNILQQWGWLQPPDFVIHDAGLTARLQGKQYAEIIQGLALTQKHLPNTLSLDELTAAVPELFNYYQKIESVREGIQYFETLDRKHIDLHEDMLEPEIRQECERFDAVLMRLQNHSNVLLFPDVQTSLRRFQQLSGVSRIQSALAKRSDELVLAICDREVLLNVMRQTEDSAVADEGTVTVIYDHGLRSDPTLAKLANIHDLVIRSGGTDIHIDPKPNGKILVKARIFGELQSLAETLNVEQYHSIKSFLLRQSGARIKLDRINKPLDGSYQYRAKGGLAHNVRCSYIPLGHSIGQSNELISIRLRLLPVEHGEVDLAKYNVPSVVIDAIQQGVRPLQGLVLLAGPTGSGKSTTVAGMMAEHRKIYGDKKSRLSVEDPIERFIPGVTQIQIPYALRASGDGFSVILRNILRHDPDMIWLGEIRDAETAEAALQFATTGHLVVSTIHAQTPSRAISRLLNMLPDNSLDQRHTLMDTLSLVVGQRLIKQLCTHCATSGTPNTEEQKIVAYAMAHNGGNIDLPREVSRVNESGCEHCRQGVSGMIPIHEVIEFNQQVKHILKTEAVPNLPLLCQFVDVVGDYIAQGATAVDSLSF